MLCAFTRSTIYHKLISIDRRHVHTHTQPTHGSPTLPSARLCGNRSDCDYINCTWPHDDAHRHSTRKQILHTHTRSPRFREREKSCRRRPQRLRQLKQTLLLHALSSRGAHRVPTKRHQLLTHSHIGTRAESCSVQQLVHVRVPKSYRTHRVHREARSATMCVSSRIPKCVRIIKSRLPSFNCFLCAPHTKLTAHRIVGPGRSIGQITR